MTTKTISFPVYRFPVFEDKLAKLNRRLSKISGSHSVEVISQERIDSTYIDRTGREFKNPCFQVTVCVPALLNHQGHKFLGVVNFEDGVRTVYATDEGVNFDFSTVADTDCHHCNHKRKRNVIYIFEEVATGKISHIGSTCAEEFLGIDVTAALSFSQSLFVSLEDMDEDNFFLGGGSSGFSINELFSAVSLLWQSDSVYWSSRKADIEGGVSTPHQVFSLFGTDGGRIREELKNNLHKAIKEVGVEKISSLLVEKFSNLDTSNSFNLNITEAIFKDGKVRQFFPDKVVGLVTWAIFKALNDEDETKKEDKPASQWIGNVGDKISLEGQVAKIRSISSHFGHSLLVIIETAMGVAKTFTTARWSDNIQEGDKLNLKGLVKSHEEYRGEKSTVLTRVRIN